MEERWNTRSSFNTRFSSILHCEEHARTQYDLDLDVTVANYIGYFSSWKTYGFPTGEENFDDY